MNLQKSTWWRHTAENERKKQTKKKIEREKKKKKNISAKSALPYIFIAVVVVAQSLFWVRMACVCAHTA